MFILHITTSRENIPVLEFLNKNLNYVFSLFLYSTSGHCLLKSSLQLMVVSVFRSGHGILKTNKHIRHKWGFIVFYSKKKILYNDDFIHYIEIFFV